MSVSDPYGLPLDRTRAGETDNVLVYDREITVEGSGGVGGRPG
ncbi:hypothetical protein [Streptomyces sp. NPDC058964]